MKHSLSHLVPPVVTILLVMSLSTGVRAQGNDLCANAQVIAGTGSFAFDNTTATTDGVADPACDFFGQSDITNDVWYSWNAPATGTFRLSTCGATMDSKVAVYAGSCAGAVIGCNDNSCGTQTSLDVAVTAGNTYIIRLGNFPGALPGVGVMSITTQGQLAVLDTQVSPINGHVYMLLAGGSWTSAESTAVALGGHLATVRSQAEHDWLTATWHNYQGVDIDMWIGLTDQAQEGTFAWVSGEPVTYTNWDTGEPNNGGAGEDYADMRKNNPAAFWNDLPDAPPITGAHYNPHGVVELGLPVCGTWFCNGDGTGTACPCGNNTTSANEGCLSSLGVGGQISGTGIPSVSNDTVVLAGTNMPSSNCLYFQGTTQLAAGAGSVFGDGLRCAGGTVTRLGTKLNVAGASQYPTGADAHVSVKGAIPAGGGTRTYQVWYRNAAAFCTSFTFNLTNGLSVTWTP